MTLDLDKNIKEEIDQFNNMIESSQSISLEKLYKHKDSIFKEDSVVDYQNLLNKILTVFIQEVSDGSQLIDSIELINMRGELINSALNKGAKINDIDDISFEVLENHFELLLNHPINPIDSNKLLKLVLSESIIKYNSVSQECIPDQTKIKTQGRMIQAALNKGAKINDSDIYISIENLSNHYDLFLNHNINPLSLEKFIQLTIIPTYPEDKGESIADTKYTEKKAKLLEIAYKVASTNNSLDLKEIPSIESIVAKELSERGVIDDQTMLKLTLKASGITWTQNKDYYDLDSVALQKKLLNKYLTQGLKIDALSFNELNIKDNHISVLKLLLKNGLDPKALMLHSWDKEDSLEVLNLAFEKKVKVPPLKFIDSLFKNGISAEVFEILISNMRYLINNTLTPEFAINDYINQGPKFKEYFDESTKDVIFEDTIKPFFAEGGTLLHILVKSDQKELVKYVLANYSHNINALNHLGQTPLFFAQSPEVAKALIDSQADLSVKDHKGNIWISNPSLELIDYAVTNNYLSGDYAKKVALSHFAKGNYEHAAKLYNIGFELNVDPREQMVNSIMNGLHNSIEKNKYQVMLHLINKAGIKIPNEFTGLLNSIRDEHKQEEFEFLNGLIHKLAQHYINISKVTLAKSLGESEDLDAAFISFDFSQLKLNHPNNLELAKITDEFTAYYQIAGKALNILDNDFALEALTINGLKPDPMDKDITVYRGMKVNLSPDDIDSYFKFGHRGFSAGEYQKTLGFYVGQPWNEIGVNWEYGGTYSSVEALFASDFANGLSTHIEAVSILLEVIIPAGTAKICGSCQDVYELITSTIYGENIVAIYTLDIYSDTNGKQYQVNKVHQNPYIDSANKPHFKSYEKIKSDPLSIKAYNDLGCHELPTLSGKSALYKNYTDFIESYTSENFAIDQDKLTKDYFAGRELYVEEFTYHLNGECDLQIECCII